MTSLSGENLSVSECEAVREQLARILKSGPFKHSQRRQRFLQYIVEEGLAGRGDRLKGYAIAVEVFDKPVSFDPLVDPVVRIEAARLRDKLREYYDSEGRSDAVRIELPKGSYAPQFLFGLDAAPQPAQPEGEGSRGDAAIAAAPPVATGLASLPAALDSTGGRWLTAGLLLAMLAATTWAGLEWRDRPPLPDRPSIAVLPFDNIGRDAKWDRLSDGLTEDIITDLSHAKDLIVIARNSTEVYRGKPVDIRQVGRDLNVKYVLEGSIQASGERIRVTAQLIEAASGSHVWSERYDRHGDDLFAVQTDVTQRIAATLIGYQGAVAAAERGLVRRKPPASLTAYDTYLLGIEAKHRVTPESLAEAERLFRRAIELDPQFARAYCGLATVQYYLIDLGLAPSVPEAVQKMADAAEMAVKFDPNDGLTHQVLGMAYGYQGKPQQSLAEFDRAEQLAPSDADLLLAIAWSLPTLGQSQRAVALAERALALNPRYPDWYNQGFSFVYFFAEQYEKSVKYRLLVKAPQPVDQAYLSMAYAYLGQTKEAETAAASIRQRDPNWNAERYLSEAGGYPDREAGLFVAGARKAGLPDCVSTNELKDNANLIRVKSCDEQRARTSG